MIPDLTTEFTGNLMLLYLKFAEPMALTDSYVFNTPDYGISIRVGFGLFGKSQTQLTIIAGSLLAGFAEALLLSIRRK